MLNMMCENHGYILLSRADSGASYSPGDLVTITMDGTEREYLVTAVHQDDIVLEPVTYLMALAMAAVYGCSPLEDEGGAPI